MASDKIIYYDSDFIEKFEKLKELIEEENWPVLQRYLIDNFGFCFKLFQYYAKEIANGNARDFDEADEETKRELMRPLSHRQYRMVERAFSNLKEEEDLIIWSIWDFLHDNERIYEKKVMSVAEIDCCSLIYEEVLSCLARRVK